MTSGTGQTLFVTGIAFMLTLGGIAQCRAVHDRARQQVEHSKLQQAFQVQASELETARSEMALMVGTMRFQSDAFQSLRQSHEELQALHVESMDWGPLRAPRDCVREVILIDERAWPVSRDADLAYYIKANEWCEDTRLADAQELESCTMMMVPDWPEPPDPRASDSNSSSIDWPEGFVVQPRKSIWSDEDRK